MRGRDGCTAATSVSPRWRARREERENGGRTVVRARRLELDNVTSRRCRRRGRVLERVLDVQTTREVARWHPRASRKSFRDGCVEMAMRMRIGLTGSRPV